MPWALQMPQGESSAILPSPRRPQRDLSTVLRLVLPPGGAGRRPKSRTTARCGGGKDSTKARRSVSRPPQVVY